MYNDDEIFEESVSCSEESVSCSAPVEEERKIDKIKVPDVPQAKSTTETKPRLYSVPKAETYAQKYNETDYNKYRLKFQTNNHGKSYTVMGVSYDFKDTVVDIPSKFNGKPVTEIGKEAFMGNRYIKTLNIPNSVITIEDRAFKNCSYLLDINIPDSVINIGYEAFENTDWLYWQPQGVVYAGKIAYTFKGSIYEKNSIVLKYGTRAIGELAFCGSGSGVTDITIPNSVEKIGSSAFFSCGYLSNITLPNSVKEIGVIAFQYCGNLRNITFSKNLTRIDDGAFTGCRSLTTIELPKSLQYIGKEAFKGCENLTDIYFKGSRKLWQSVEKGNDAIPANCKLHFRLF